MSTDANQTPNESAPVRKFMFERSFDNASVVHRAAERKPVLMKPEQIDALKKESYDTGVAAGKIAGKDEQIGHQTVVLNHIDQHLNALIKDIVSIAQEQEDHTRALVMTIVKKLLPSFAAQSGLLEIETLVNETVSEMKREPRLVVRVHENEFEALENKIQEISAKNAYSGKIILLADDSVASGDCRIEWSDGGVERNTPATMSAIEQTLLSSS